MASGRVQDVVSTCAHSGPLGQEKESILATAAVAVGAEATRPLGPQYDGGGCKNIGKTLKKSFENRKKST